MRQAEAEGRVERQPIIEIHAARTLNSCAAFSNSGVARSHSALKRKDSTEGLVSLQASL